MNLLENKNVIKKIYLNFSLKQHFFHQKELFRYVHHVQYVKTDEIAQALKKAKELPSSRVEEKIDLDLVIEKLKEI